MIKYGLMHKGKLLGFDVTCNSTGEFCVAVAYSLAHEQNIWCVDTFEDAERVRITHSEWWEASYETPVNPFRSEDLTVVQLTIGISIK